MVLPGRERSLNDHSQNQPVTPGVQSSEIIIVDAIIDDAPAVLSFLDPFIERQQLLPRTIEEIKKLSENGFLAKLDDEIVGFAAIEIYSRKLAEIQCWAVCETIQGRGVGTQLIQCCTNRAKDRGVLELMVITASEQLLQRCGFDYSLPNQKRALFIQPQQILPQPPEK